MKKYLLAILLSIISVGMSGQQWTKERVKTELQKKEFLKSSEIVRIFENLFDNQQKLGGVMLPGVKTSEQVAKDYCKDALYDDIAAKYLMPMFETPDHVFTDGERQDYVDNKLEENSSDLINSCLKSFCEWSLMKYGKRYQKSNLTDEQAVANLKKIPNGIYKKARFKRAGQEVYQKSLSQYNQIINRGKAYWMGIGKVDYNNGTYQFRIKPDDIRVLKVNAGSYQSVWTNSDPKSTDYAFGTETVDEFESLNSGFVSTFFNMLGSIEGGKKKSDNRFVGTWRCVKGYIGKYQNFYKVYGENNCMIVEYNEKDGDFNMQGEYLKCEYTPDGNIVERGNVCYIEWIDNNTFTLKWKNTNGRYYTETFVREPMSDAVLAFARDSKAAMGKTKPLPASPEELMAVLDDMEDNIDKWNGYQKILDMPKANTPEGWGLKARALYQMALMQGHNYKWEEAAELAAQALKIAEEHAVDGTAEATDILAKIHLLNADGAFETHTGDCIAYMCEEYDMALRCLDEFHQLATKEPTKWKEELAKFDDTYMDAIVSLTDSYSALGEHRKVISTGNQALQAWNRTSEDFKNEMYRLKYSVDADIMNAALQLGDSVLFEKEANVLAAFLADISEKYQNGEVSIDETTRYYLASNCGSLLLAYGKQHDYERSEEFAVLALTFVPDERNNINYQLCQSLIDCGRYEEADKLHTEVMKDEEFAKSQLEYFGDPVAEELKKYIQPKEEVKAEVATPAEDVQQTADVKKKAETRKKINSELASINQELKKAQGDDKRAKIKGYNASGTNATKARKDKNGRVALPVGSAKDAGVGIHFKF